MKQFITKLIKIFLDSMKEKTNNQKQTMKIGGRKELNELDNNEISIDAYFIVIFFKVNCRKFMEGTHFGGSAK